MRKTYKDFFCTLPHRFKIKITAIEGAQDIIKIKADKLIRSLLTYEMFLDESLAEKKLKRVVFKPTNCDSKSQTNNVYNDACDVTLVILGNNLEELRENLRGDRAT